ncbi:MAG: hypothetical protein QOH76_3886 [Thermoleophilaceae bacterium]|jgi:hypothetical protein|nr:hypothetical protein [Thermoleophilaceae bacterium]
MERLIDEWLPSFDESEFHAREIAAPPPVVESALRSLEARELRLTGLLMGLRTLPGRLTGRARPPRSGRLFDGVLSMGFVLLGERPGEQVVLGVAGRPWRPRGDGLDGLEAPEDFRSYERPGSVRCVWDFVMAPTAGGTRLSTETRIAGTDAAGTRTFRRYWRLVMPGSALIRRDLLRAVARRAEA